MFLKQFKRAYKRKYPKIMGYIERGTGGKYAERIVRNDHNNDRQQSAERDKTRMDGGRWKYT